MDIIIRELIHRLNDDNSVVLKANNTAIGALTKCVPVEELVKHIRYIKDLIGSMVSDARYRKGGVGDGDFFLPGLNIPKGKCLYDYASHDSFENDDAKNYCLKSHFVRYTNVEVSISLSDST